MTAIRGIGVEGVASEIGALSRSGPFVVKRQDLVANLRHRFKADDFEADQAIWRALEAGIIEEDGENIVLVLEPKPEQINITSITIYMRNGDWYEQEERIAAEKYFITTAVRTGIPENSLVIPRYSALPFYQELEEDCKNLNSKLINTYQEHTYVADITKWYQDLKEITPLTLETWNTDMPGSWVVKGKTNSRKNQWKNRMFAPTAKDIPRVVGSLYEDDLIASQGVVVRQYVPLKRLGEGINSMPISHEWRFFVLDKQILASGYYWASEPDTDPSAQYATYPWEAGQLVQEVIRRVGDKIRFYVVDVAEKENGEWIVIELNDGQQSGLGMIDPDKFYKQLKERLD